LKDRYQHYTQADITGLRAAGYKTPFTALEDGVKQTFAEEPVRQDMLFDGFAEEKSFA
jgi:ADP-L-glycero-D-manno-heptose 6-epimerase